MTNSDSTFITNEPGQKLLDRFKVLIKNTEFFDVLVGYFFTSGFYALYESLESTKKIRILIGISTNRETLTLINESSQMEMQFSHAETKGHFSDLVSKELEYSKDSRDVEAGILKFIEWLKTGKLEIKAYPTQNIHAKLYIMSFAEGVMDRGRVITGSSNFTQAGLVDNLEFNVELKNRSDYEFAKGKFEELWKSAVDVSDKYIETIQKRTWLNNTISPYELYLKFLYEYFQDELGRSDDLLFRYVPEQFKKLEYQEQAVLNAKKILLEYGGVFISDVVGLGKTYVSAMLADQLDGRTLVIAPPVLLEPSNPGSWPNVFSDFKVHADFRSRGKLDSLAEKGTQKYKNVFIDEAHAFRTESNVTYETLARICRGKRVVLITATPFNNSPKDILSQIKLFQKGKRSTIPNVSNLEAFFNGLDKKIKSLDRKEDQAEYISTAKENAREIREKVLNYLMVRRTRSEIERFFGEDLKKQGMKFPEVIDPEPLFYELNEKEDEIFNRTVELITQKFKYSRYTPLLYYKGKLTQPEEQGQKNMGRFMKILLIKRLESSFYAFRNTVQRFIYSYELFLKEIAKGNVYVSKKHIYKVFELLDNDDDEAIQRLIDEDKAKKYPAKEFKREFQEDLEYDLDTLMEIKSLWQGIERDPKLLEFVEKLKSRKILKESKLIVFTESKETADYLASELKKRLNENVLPFTGGSTRSLRERVIENFDARSYDPKDDYRILIATEVLSEGVNLHRSNVVINYDIPWNPTRLMQRVGRINRVDTGFDKIYTFNFFPTKQANNQLKLKEAAEAKIQAFISLLGADARLLTEGEAIESHELFNRLVSKKTITGEDNQEESELKYLHVIREIRDNDPDLFTQIKNLPKKARTARKTGDPDNKVITFFRKGKLQKFFIANENSAQELDFITTAKTLETQPDTKRLNLPDNFYDLLEKNANEFLSVTMEEMIPDMKSKGGRDSASQLIKMLKAVKDFRQFTDDQEGYWKKVICQLEEGGIPKPTSKKTLKDLKVLLKREVNPLKILALIQKNIPDEFLEGHIAESAAQTFGPREVILSEYLIGDSHE